jgi:tRNA (adenine37-N6)-methyltransferase
MEITFLPIGTICSPFTEISGMPIQPAGAAGIQGTIRLLPQYVEGLRDLIGFSHITLLYQFHRSQEVNLTIIPFLDSKPHGIFATRAPKRPNPIGLSVVRLLSIKGDILNIENVDILDGTPLLDIKPYVPEFDHQSDVRVGWLENAKGQSRIKLSDDRFS